MHESLALPDLGALAPGLYFAAGALVVTLVQGAIVACKALWAEWRASRRQEFPPDDPTRIWAELKQLRAECATSATGLETVVSRLRDAIMTEVVERDARADRLERLQRTLEEKSATIGDLEQQKAALELLRETHLLQLQRQDEELGSRSSALAAAEQTIALLRGLIGRSDRVVQAPVPTRRAV